jgi:hypothetical protein
MLILDLQAESGELTLFSAELRYFYEKCFLFFQQGEECKVLYNSIDKDVRLVSPIGTCPTDLIPWTWDMLTRSFASRMSKTKSSTIYWTKDKESRILNATLDLTDRLGGKLTRIRLDDLIVWDDEICRLKDLDSIPQPQGFLVAKNLLATSGNKEFWSYQFFAIKTFPCTLRSHS